MEKIVNVKKIVNVERNVLSHAHVEKIVNVKKIVNVERRMDLNFHGECGEDHQ